MGKYIVAESLSSMQGLQIPIVDIHDYAVNINEKNTLKESTMGYKQLSVTEKVVAFTIENGEPWEKFNSAGVALLKDPENIINARVSLSNAPVKYYTIVDGVGTSFCDDNKKSASINRYDYAFFSKSGEQGDKIIILSYTSADGSTYITPYSWTNDQKYIFTSGMYFYNISEIGDFTIYEKSEEYGNYSDAGGYGGGSSTLKLLGERGVE